MCPGSLIKKYGLKDVVRHTDLPSSVLPNILMRCSSSASLASHVNAWKTTMLCGYRAKILISFTSKMSAALIELVSVGAQDVYITGDPQVSFFRQNYKRYTNFAMKPERMDYIGVFGSNNEISIPIRSKGDLLSYVWVEATNIAAIQEN